MLVVKSQLTRRNQFKIRTLLTVRSLVVMLLIRGLLVVAALRLVRSPSLLPAIVTSVLFVIFQMVSLVRSCITSRNRNLLLPYVFVIDNETIIVKTPLSAERIKWEALIGWRKVVGHYLLFTSDSHYYCIQESSIESEKREAFNALLTSKVPKKRRSRRLKRRNR